MSTRRRAIDVEKTAGLYSGVKMNAVFGTHEEVERMILKHFGRASEQDDRKVLDIAAGHGAMTKRLMDLGFNDVHAWELDITQMMFPDVPVQPMDLNTDFGSSCPEEFDLVVAIEVIEHLENPRHFFRNMAMIVKPGGIVIVSSPNVESAMSRMDFLARGGVRWFTLLARESWGHITPVFSWQVHEASKAAGLKLLERGQNSTALVTRNKGRSQTIKAALGLLLYPFMSGNKDGDINVWAFRRKK